MAVAWQLIAILAMGVFFLTLGAFVRLGLLRRWMQSHFGPDLESPAGHMVFGLIPMGTMAILEALAIACMEAGRPWSYLGVAFAYSAIENLVLSWLLTTFPPDWIKPRWLQDRESRDRTRRY